jgi:ABC-type amino acid transport substrate-binding protein
MRRAPALLSSPAPHRLAFAAALALLLALFAAPGPAMARVVTLATLDWAPYISPHLPGQGYVAAIAREALARSGLEAQFVFLPWLRAVEGAQDGHYDGYLPAYADADATRGMVCSQPFPGGPLALFARADSTLTYDGVDDLRGLRVGVVLGYRNTRVIDHTPGLDLRRSPDDLTNLRTLLAGRVDVAVADAYVAAHLAPELDREKGDLRLVAVLEKKSLTACFAEVLPDHAALVGAFNQGLAAMRADGTLERLLRTHDCAPAHLSAP